MAYLDTKELPWDMDLSVFEGNNSETRDSQNNVRRQRSTSVCTCMSLVVSISNVA